MKGNEDAGGTGSQRAQRVDAMRNLDALVDAATAVFATSGVDAPAKEITDRAGLGVGTLYRHFPRRADLLVAVLRQEIDACAATAADLRADHSAHEALRRWVTSYVALVGTKRGLAGALQSEDAAFAGLGEYVAERLEPIVAALLGDARAHGEVDADINARELLFALAMLCHPVPAAGIDPDYTLRMASVFIDGLRRTA